MKPCNDLTILASVGLEKLDAITWMSQEVSKWLVNGL